MTTSTSSERSAKRIKLTRRQRDVLADVVLSRVTFTCYPGGTGAVYWANADDVDRRDVSVTVRALQAKNLVEYVPEGTKLRGAVRYRITVIQP